MTTLVPQINGIDRTRDTHVAALNANDAVAWTGCFTSDAVQMPPNDAANVGIDNIRAWTTGMLTAFRVEFALEVHELELTGDAWAFERGGYTITLMPAAGGDPVRDRGKYITIYERQVDGSWLVARDIWNSDHQLHGGGQ
jgi:uncharacterized protein (TIGR02246 family)